jgi:hypothetical protein
MTIEITRRPETPASDPLDALQQNGVHTQDQASDTTVPITEGVRRKELRWVALLSRIFMAAPKESRPKQRPNRPRMPYLEHTRMAREMERL